VLVAQQVSRYESGARGGPRPNGRELTEKANSRPGSQATTVHCVQYIGLFDGPGRLR